MQTLISHETALAIQVERSPVSRYVALELENLSFGKQPTDHMFIARYANGHWHNARIVPFAPLTLSPFALTFHYGQTVFEGMKAFRMQDGNISVFRMDKHHNRFNQSLERMCMPAVAKSLFENAIHKLIEIDAPWVPEKENTALYLRPFMIATEEKLRVKASEEYAFMVVATPVGPYYQKALRLKVETKYIRAAPGGTGGAKCGGNYGAAFLPTYQANQQGFDQVLWTESENREYIEESGTMNVFFSLNEKLITPPLHTILDGVTRDSLLVLAREQGMVVEERRISIKEVQYALENGQKVEAFGAGTAAVVSPIEYIQVGEKGYSLYTGKDARMYTFREQLQAIRTGKVEDTHHWNYIIHLP